MRVKEVLKDAAQGVIYETLISTISGDGSPNIAPIGLIFRDEDLKSFELRIFKESKTYQNLLDVGEGVVNITRDPRPFVLGCIPELREKILKDLEPAKIVKPLRLRGAEAYIEFVVQDIKEDSSSKVTVICRPLEAYPGELRIEPYSRAIYSLIEAAINASRARVFMNNSRKLLEILQEIDRSRNILRRTAAGTIYEEVLIDLIKALQKILQSRPFDRPSP